MRGPKWARGLQNDHRWDCDHADHGSNPPAHMSPASVLVAERGEWRLMRSTLARGYYAVAPEHGYHLLRSADEVGARREFDALVEGRA